eukprot:TRINITY_DN4485_c0_g1_i4.p1 TRINITY_DN4485_c0_g1~~TRINITY_DN4485_c0_g1_i4.p1  ORF type:complete len:288 (-),score=86.13 TRINITY_DN4485_c0_g1_i4:149-1012(-)
MQSDEKEEKLKQKFNEIVGFLQKRDYVVKYEEIKIGLKIGEGSYSKVFEGEWGGYHVAVKKLKNKNITEKFFMREVSTLASSHHMNVVIFMGACISPPCIVTEYMAGGTLYDVLHVRNVKLDIPLVIKMAKDIASGMAHLHSINILHRDLTSRNILLDEFQNVKISDFGLSRELQSTMTLAGICNPRWRPPEITKGVVNYNGKVDVYCFALILYEMVTNKLPFDNLDSVTAAAKAAYEGLRPPLSTSECPLPLIVLMTEAWADKPEHRPSFLEIITKLDLIAESLQK